MYKAALVVIVIMLGLMSVVGAQRPDAPEYAQRGPYSIGFMSFAWDGESNQIDGAIWYPAANETGAEEEITYQLVASENFPPAINFFDGHAIADAAPDVANGPFPLIVSSHGYGGSPIHMAYQHEHLASHGFVVISIAHDGNTLRQSIGLQSEEQQMAFAVSSVDSMIRRPLEIGRAIDLAQTMTDGNGNLAGAIDLESVGVIGMSYGGYTAVMMAGVQPDFRETIAFCDFGVFGSPISQLVCNMHREDLQTFESHLLEVAGLDMEPGQMWPSLGDPRVDATVAIVPGGGLALVSEEGLAAADKPIMILRGGMDEVDLAENNAQRVFNNVSSANKTLVTIENASHTFALQCGPGLEAAMFNMCIEPIWDKERVLDLTHHLATAFFLSELYGSSEAAGMLAAENIQFPGITYETTGF